MNRINIDKLPTARAKQKTKSKGRQTTFGATQITADTLTRGDAGITASPGQDSVLATCVFSLSAVRLVDSRETFSRRLPTAVGYSSSVGRTGITHSKYVNYTYII